MSQRQIPQKTGAFRIMVRLYIIGGDPSGEDTEYTREVLIEYPALVEADDMNDPIADSVRSILDGHIVLTRELATQNHYPAIDVLESVSRLTRDLLTPEQLELTGRAREHMATYRKNQDLINIGAYPPGSSPVIDEAIRLHGPLRQFLRQPVGEGFLTPKSWAALAAVMAPPPPKAPPRPNRQ